MSLIEDLEIIDRVLEGDKDAFADLVRLYHVRVYRLCLGMLGAPDKADDAAQDVFIKAYRSLASFRRQSQFSTWLYRLTANHCMDVLRSESRRKTESWEALLAQNPEKLEKLFSAPASDPSSREEALEMAQALLSQLPPDYLLVLTLREIEGLSYEEIAETLKTSLDSVKARLQRARKELSDKARHFLKIESSKD